MRVGLTSARASVFLERMLFRTYTPQSPLSEFVEIIWFYDGHQLPHAKERLLPTGTMEMVFNLREDRTWLYGGENADEIQAFRGSILCGVHSKFFVIDTAAEISTFGVHFKPGGAFPFFNLPVGELHNIHVSLETLWGATADDIRNQLLEASTPDARFRVLENALLARAAGSFDRHPAVAFALKEFRSVPHTRTIADVSGQTGFSPRRFIQVFNEEVGLTPKLFCRVLRFQKVLRLIKKGQAVDWADVAASCGYFDQAHFIHDFRAFSGLNPSAYLAQHTEHLNHVPILD
jgi:AraC-like DNA-binding protein